MKKDEIGRGKIMGFGSHTIQLDLYLPLPADLVPDKQVWSSPYCGL